MHENAGRNRVDRAIWRIPLWSALFLASILIAEGLSIADLMVSSIAAVFFVSVGYAAARRIPLEEPAILREMSSALAIGLGAGAVMGTLNFGANWALASIDPRIADHLRAVFSEHPGLLETAGGAVIEEVVFRLFLMSVVAWLVVRTAGSRQRAFATSLVASTLIFAVLHLPGREIGLIYGIGVVGKSAVLGTLLGLLYWRHGLGAAVITHFMANMVHQLLEPLVF